MHPSPLAELVIDPAQQTINLAAECVHDNPLLHWVGYAMNGLFFGATSMLPGMAQTLPVNANEMFHGVN